MLDLRVTLQEHQPPHSDAGFVVQADVAKKILDMPRQHLHVNRLLPNSICIGNASPKSTSTMS